MPITCFRSQPPPVLYKYLDVEGARKTLRPNGWVSVMFSKPDKFNDPFDCLPAGMKLKSDRNLRRDIVRVLEKNKEEACAAFAKRGLQFNQIIEGYRSGRYSLNHHRSAILKSDGSEYQKLFAEKVSILSLSSSFDNVAMWSYYAEKHGGIVIGVKPRAFRPLSIYRVEYSRNRPKIGQNKNDENAIRKFTVKALVWRHEREWRVVAMNDNIRRCREFRGLPIWTDKRILWEIEPSNIVCILLGVRCQDTKLLQRICEFSDANPSCIIMRTESNRDKFKLNFIHWRTYT